MKNWLFFDVGFTLIDETQCYQDHVLQCTQQLALEGIYVTPEAYYQQMMMHQNKDKNRLKLFGKGIHKKRNQHGSIQVKNVILKP